MQLPAWSKKQKILLASLVGAALLGVLILVIAILPRGAAEREGEAKQDYGADEIPELAVVRARAMWDEIAGGIGRSATALMRRLDALTDPERVEDANMLAAWREKYENEITERTKKRWWRRLVKAAGEKMARGRPERGKAVRGKAA